MSPPIFINLGYILILVALTVRDLLWLRSIFILAHLSFITYAVLSRNLSMAIWNTLFLMINIFHVVRIMRDRRPMALPPDLKAIHQDLFSAMSPKEFFYFWQMGEVTQVADRLLAQDGKPQQHLHLLLAGAARVVKNGTLVAQLAPGNFIGEMSFLEESNASADVEAIGLVRLISWEQEKLKNIRESNPAFFVRIQSALGSDLVRKTKSARSS
ncbi:MAG: cyclic nucleotide-binding domain-containing protein [Nitrospirae bacterium]|nr:cyclic nucleotide-binding domain-containing protein [Candidatus Troglogloeales bacterium]